MLGNGPVRFGGRPLEKDPRAPRQRPTQPELVDRRPRPARRSRGARGHRRSRPSPPSPPGCSLVPCGAGVPARWLTGDEVYGNDPTCAPSAKLNRIGYVLAIGCDRRVPTPAGPSRADELVHRPAPTCVAAPVRRRGREGTAQLRLGLDHPCSEIRRLFTSYVIEPGRTLACPDAWSRWRRGHQHRARTSHYQRQEASCAWT